jgi:hypothetical protein
MRSIGEKGFVLGGLLILLVAYDMSDSKTLIPSSIKIAGGIFLIGYGLFRILRKKQ